ncbi:MAG: 3-deoxy-manno-octulosonate cytidylyltransferase [Bacteroidota bacterium]|nr:3-deoxy-manno-octulosonate cytidylyltransferase [Bacteroidota bacterium]
MKILGVIPARYASVRFPGKMLASILGESMISRVYKQALKCTLLNNLIIATDDKKIYDHVKSFGGNVMLTSSMHESGTDRCNEVISKLNESYDAIINIQGDEPFIDPQQIEQVALLLNNKSTQIATLAKHIKNKNDLLDSNTPKVFFKKNMFATKFVRKLNNEDLKQKKIYKHIGIYGYKTSILSKITKLEPTKNELNQKLEQLRWLDNNYTILIGITKQESISIDTPEDILKIS